MRLFGFHLHHRENPWDDAPPWALELHAHMELIHLIQEKIMATLDEVLAEVTDESTRLDSIQSLIDGIKQQLEEKISITSRQISDLAGIVSGMAGGDIGKEKTIKLANWGIGIAVAIGLGLIGIVAQIFMLIWKK